MANRLEEFCNRVLDDGFDLKSPSSQEYIIAQHRIMGIVEMAKCQIREEVSIARIDMSEARDRIFSDLDAKLDKVQATARHRLLRTDKANLRDMHYEFADEMIGKMLKCAADGKHGWDDPAWAGSNEAVKFMFDHVWKGIEDPNQWVDVANIAAFLWWHHVGRHRVQPSLDDPKPCICDDGFSAPKEENIVDHGDHTTCKQCDARFGALATPKQREVVRKIFGGKLQHAGRP